MRTLIIFGLALVASAAGLVEVQRGYLEEVAIPLAEKIRKYEEGLLQNNGRIIGGVLAPTNAHPHFAGLLINIVGATGQGVCGSSLLTHNRLVTAAHCWFDGNRQAWQFTVILGTNFLFSGGTRIATSQVIMHQNYNSAFLHNDVAMIYLPTNVLFSVSIQPIDIPSSTEVWESFAGHWAVAAGFGRTSDQQAAASTVVSQVNLQVITVPVCQLTYGTTFVIDSTLCTSGAGFVGVCGGDSGGPLDVVYNGRRVLIGVASFVAATGCALGHPSAFARVTSFRSFITQHM